MNNERHELIESAIARYASAYEDLETLQKGETAMFGADAFLPCIGDQKTGVIGEYWALRYARAAFKDAKVVCGQHSQKGWDFKVTTGEDKPLYIQLKTTSDFGAGKLSPICPPSDAHSENDKIEASNYWDELWLLALGRSLTPVEMWRLKPEQVNFNGRPALKGKTMRRGGSPLGGSDCFNWFGAIHVPVLHAAWAEPS